MEVTSACAFPQPKLVIMGSLGTLIRDGEDFVIKYLDPKTLPKLKVDDRLAVPNRKYGVIGETLQWREQRVLAEPAEFKIDFYGDLFHAIREKKKPMVKPEEVFEQMRVNALSRKGTKFVVKG